MTFVAGLICKALSLGKCPVLGDTLSVLSQDFISINASNLRGFGGVTNFVFSPQLTVLQMLSNTRNASLKSNMDRVVALLWSI